MVTTGREKSLSWIDQKKGTDTCVFTFPFEDIDFSASVDTFLSKVDFTLSLQRLSIQYSIA